MMVTVDFRQANGQEKPYIALMAHFKNETDSDEAIRLIFGLNRCFWPNRISTVRYIFKSSFFCQIVTSVSVRNALVETQM